MTYMPSKNTHVSYLNLQQPPMHDMDYTRVGGREAWFYTRFMNAPVHAQWNMVTYLSDQGLGHGTLMDLVYALKSASVDPSSGFAAPDRQRIFNIFNLTNQLRGYICGLERSCAVPRAEDLGNYRHYEGCSKALSTTDAYARMFGVYNSVKLPSGKEAAHKVRRQPAVPSYRLPWWLDRHESLHSGTPHQLEAVHERLNPDSELVNMPEYEKFVSYVWDYVYSELHVHMAPAQDRRLVKDERVAVLQAIRGLFHATPEDVATRSRSESLPHSAAMCEAMFQRTIRESVHAAVDITRFDDTAWFMVNKDNLFSHMYLKAAGEEAPDAEAPDAVTQGAALMRAEIEKNIAHSIYYNLGVLFKRARQTFKCPTHWGRRHVFRHQHS